MIRRNKYQLENVQVDIAKQKLKIKYELISQSKEQLTKVILNNVGS
jgi:hypothetical protein